MKKNDWILIIFVAAVAGIFLAVLLLRPEEAVRQVEISVDGELYGRYDLNEDQEISINKTNKVQISEGTAKMTWAECPDQICVHHKEISRTGESIICLPNKIVVSIIGGDATDGGISPDAVSN